MPTSYLAPLPRYRGSKVDRKRFRPYGDVTGRKRRRHSTDPPRFPISAQCTPTSYLAPLPRYSGSKVAGSGFGHTVTSQRVNNDAIRQTCLGFLLVLNARRPRISHRYRVIAVRKWTGSSFGHTVTSRTGSDDAIRKIDPGFLLGAQCTPTSYLAPLPRYSRSKVDRKRFRAFDDVTDRNRRRRSKDRPRFAIGAQCMPTFYLLPFPRYGASKSCRRLDSQGIGRLPLLRLADFNWG
jgi:hypothetical protein